MKGEAVKSRAKVDRRWRAKETDLVSVRVFMSKGMVLSLRCTEKSLGKLFINP